MVHEVISLQRDMFTGELVDNRSRDQKRADREKVETRQLEMFRQKDIAQFGVSANPLMPYSPGKLVLMREDPRTPEEIEADTQREAERLTRPLFEALPPSEVAEQPAELALSATEPQPVFASPSGLSLPAEVNLRGYRRRSRHVLLPLRERQDRSWLLAS